MLESIVPPAGQNQLPRANTEAPSDEFDQAVQIQAMTDLEQ